MQCLIVASIQPVSTAASTVYKTFHFTHTLMPHLPVPKYFTSSTMPDASLIELLLFEELTIFYLRVREHFQSRFLAANFSVAEQITPRSQLYTAQAPRRRFIYRHQTSRTSIRFHRCSSFFPAPLLTSVERVVGSHTGH